MTNEIPGRTMLSIYYVHVHAILHTVKITWNNVHNYKHFIILSDFTNGYNLILQDSHDRIVPQVTML